MTLTLVSYLQDVQTNTLPFYGLGASSISSTAVNASEVRSHCSQGESLSPSPSYVAGTIAYPRRRTFLTLSSINQTRHRSRLALQPLLFRSVLFYLGSLDESTPQWLQSFVRPMPCFAASHAHIPQCRPLPFRRVMDEMDKTPTSESEILDVSSVSEVPVGLRFVSNSSHTSVHLGIRKFMDSASDLEDID